MLSEDGTSAPESVRCSAARAGDEFAVEVKFHVREGAGGTPVGLAISPEVAEQIRHGGGTEQFGRAQRQTAHGAQLLLELTGHASIDGEMARVMRPWR